MIFENPLYLFTLSLGSEKEHRNLRFQPPLNKIFYSAQHVLSTGVQFRLTNEQIMHIGLDDTDSTRKGCTTYVTALLIEELQKLKVSFLDYPKLIRLNPNVPWKTRGNGALSLKIKHTAENENKIKEITTRLVEEHSDLDFKETNPGIVFFPNDRIPEDIKIFSENAITGIVSLKDAEKLIKKFGGEALGFKNCRGKIGALAAVGKTFEKDYTYELIAYRVPENRGSKRRVDKDSIFEMDELTKPYTFNNVDLEKGRIVITPRGPDPILFGIRGENPMIVKQAFDLAKPMEQVERWVIFRSNQGTDAHLRRISKLKNIKPYQSVIAKGSVSRNPRLVPLRHVIFSIRDKTDEVDCAAYEPTGTLRKVARKLIVGDNIEVYGAVRRISPSNRLTINLEKLKILELAPKKILQNPSCPNCSKRLKSMGKDQGFRCNKCGARFKEARKVKCKIKRKLQLGLYVTSTRSQRHLTKPLRRYGLEKNGAPTEEIIENWNSY
jgi:tRNA(Ile2)-agmatinylcytidine synthase